METKSLRGRHGCGGTTERAPTIVATVTPHDRRGRHKLTVNEPVSLEVVHTAPAVEACQHLAEMGYAGRRLVVVGIDGRERFSLSIGKVAGRELRAKGDRLDGFEWRRRGADGPAQMARVCAKGTSKVSGPTHAAA